MNNTAGSNPSSEAPPFLAGGGECGALMRALDWSATAVGAVAAWPASLKTTVGTILHSRHPMFLWWGPELVQFYNDAYLPSFGRGKHPAAMGQRGADCWQEIWPIIWPQIDDVMRWGRASWNEDHLVPIYRNGRIEEVYWTYGYSPVFDDAGAIGGTLVVCTETTSRVVAARRLHAIGLLADATAALTDANAVIECAARIIAEATLDVAFAMFFVRRTQDAPPVLVGSVGLSDGAVGGLEAWVRTHLAAGSTGMHAIPLPPEVQVRTTTWPEPVSDVCVVPLGIGPHHVSGQVVFGLSPRLPLDAEYREYLRRLADHIGQAQSRIAAFHVRAVLENERNNLLEQAPVAAAFLTGPDHVFRIANSLYLQLVGRRELVGQRYLDAFPELIDTPLPAILDRAYHAGERFVSGEMPVPLDRTGTGTPEECFFRFNLEPVRNDAGQVYGMMAVAVDLTPQVVARRHLEQAQEERETLLRQLENANRAKDEFLAMLGHELRNPLSPILTALQLMRLRGVQGADREREIIERQVRHVVDLVDDLLDVSRITRGKLELKRDWVLLSDIVARAIEQASPLIEQRRHALHVDVPADLVVHADAARLSQVVSNLLTNAARYTEPGGRIDVQAVTRGEQVCVHVRDNGIGIAPHMLPTVFDAFAQERQRSDRAQGGLGLGLAIVKSLVEAHGGEVTLRSDGQGHGTECVIGLPAAPGHVRAAGSHRPALAAAVAATTGHRVLIVDDNADAAYMLAESLSALGHHAEVAADAASALDCAKRFVPRVALLDVGLPVVDGYELATRLRELEGWAAVRFAALTGYGQQHDRERSAAAGFDVHLVKPVGVDEVDRAVRHLANTGDPPASVGG